MINQTYNKPPDPHMPIWLKLLIAAMLILLLSSLYDIAYGQTNVYLSNTYDACEDYNSVYVHADMPNNVHTISWEFYFNPLEQEFFGISFAAQAFIITNPGVSLYYFVTSNSIRISWVSVFDPLQKAPTDTIIGICFRKIGNYSLLEWNHSDPNYLEITDKDGIPIDSVYYFDGSIECITSSIRELQIANNKPIKYFKNGKIYIERNGSIYNLNGGICKN